MNTPWTNIHIMASEIAGLLLTNPDGIYLDGTLGLGGHARYFLSQLSPKARIYGLDRDEKALAMATERTADERLIPVYASYIAAPQVLAAHGITQVDGALFDLGLSSYQLDDPSRGFSILADGPLDMRFDTAAPVSAADIVNTWGLMDLARIFMDYGEEHRAQQAAHAILTARRQARIETTAQLKQILEPVLGPQRGRIHPATQIFQALRIACNGELEAVAQIPAVLEHILKPGGRAAVLTFHSLEDRLIKNAFKQRCAQGGWKLVNKHTLLPSRQEVLQNRRARSAKLRVIERL